MRTIILLAGAIFSLSVFADKTASQQWVLNQNYVTKAVTNGLASTAYVDEHTPGDYENVSNKAVSALQTTDIENSVTSTSTSKALSANMGKELQDQIDNLKQRGRFLSIWNSAIGLATTAPTVNPYTYKTGDYYVVGVITNTTNYKPSGSTYTGVSSTTVETKTVHVNDTYYYDGTSWMLLATEQKSVTFGSLTGNIDDNTALHNAFEGTNDYRRTTSKIAWSDVDGSPAFVTETVTNGLATMSVAQAKADAAESAAKQYADDNFIKSYTETDPTFSTWKTGNNIIAGGTQSHGPAGILQTAYGSGTMVGNAANVTGTSAFGAGAKAYKNYDTALGYGSFAKGERSIAIGNATASNLGEVSIGYGASAHGQYNFNIAAKTLDSFWFGSTNLQTLIDFQVSTATTEVYRASKKYTDDSVVAAIGMTPEMVTNTSDFVSKRNIPFKLQPVSTATSTLSDHVFYSYNITGPITINFMPAQASNSTVRRSVAVYFTCALDTPPQVTWSKDISHTWLLSEQMEGETVAPIKGDKIIYFDEIAPNKWMVQPVKLNAMQ